MAQAPVFYGFAGWRRPLCQAGGALCQTLFSTIVVVGVHQRYLGAGGVVVVCGEVVGDTQLLGDQHDFWVDAKQVVVVDMADADVAQHGQQCIGLRRPVVVQL